MLTALPADSWWVYSWINILFNWHINIYWLPNVTNWNFVTEKRTHFSQLGDSLSNYWWVHGQVCILDPGVCVQVVVCVLPIAGQAGKSCGKMQEQWILNVSFHNWNIVPYLLGDAGATAAEWVGHWTVRTVIRLPNPAVLAFYFLKNDVAKGAELLGHVAVKTVLWFQPQQW